MMIYKAKQTLQNFSGISKDNLKNLEKFGINVMSVMQIVMA